MARRRRERRDPHYWQMVQVRLWCWLTGHEVTAGMWMRFRRGDHRRMGSCEPCLAKQGIARPVRKFTSVGEKPDYRAARSGDE